ncbi:MAG: GNAT family N-acetyltransferase [Candidatus Aminicenantes bacterium]|nr:GNAT family N-acetyltransferase [Candidatus Aminicenantes bacterium]
MDLGIVLSKADIRAFHDVPRRLYRDDPHWIAPLQGEIEAVFDPAKNPGFKYGEAVRWVLRDGEGKTAGRAAAFVDFQKARRSAVPAGGLGFFECVDDQEAACVLFDAARAWLAERGMKAMDGSVNFGENFSHWGVLVEGFEPQGYGMPYNFPYYGKLFEAYGFRDYFQQFTYHLDLDRPLPERQVKFARYLERKGGFEFRPFDRKDVGRFIRDLAEVFNSTWSDYMEDYHPLTEADVEVLFRAVKPVIVDDFIWFAYKAGRPVGMLVAFPDVNQLLSHFDGRLSLWKLPKLLWLKARNTVTRNRLLLAGVVPEFQNSGVIAPLFLKFHEAVRRRAHYTQVELSWVGDYNPRMRKVYEQIGAVPAKKHITYRYMIDPAVPFARFTNEGGNSALRKDVVGARS